MSKTPTIVCLLVMSVLCSPALALSGKDEMSAWSQASNDDRVALLDALAAKFSKTYSFEKPDLLDCLDRAAATGAHKTLMIDDIAQACAQMLGSPDGATDDRPDI